MATHEALLISSAVLMLLGIIIGAYGTYFITKPYHPFRPVGFAGSVLDVTWKILTFRKRKAVQHLLVSVRLAGVNEEDKATSLAGVYLVFVGFILQLVGGLLAAADAIMQHVSA